MKTVISQWHNLKRQKVYVVSILLLYILLALFDNRNHFFVVSYEAQLYRHIFQQLFIVFGNILLVMCVLNEQFFRVYENMLRMYLKNEKQFYLALLMMLYGATAVPFMMGQGLFLGLSLWTGGYISVQLWAINSVIVLCEIGITLNLAAALNLFLKKNLLVYVTYYLLVFTLMVSGTVYTALPLTMRILDTQGYYYTFGAPLWLGRLILLVISAAGFYASMGFALKKSQEKVGVSA